VWIGKGSGSKASPTNCKVPARFAASILYDMTRVNLAPEMAATTAASDVFTHSLDRIGTRHSRLRLRNFQAFGEETGLIAMQSWSLICLRASPRRQIGGTCANHEPDRADAGRYHTALGKATDTNGYVDTLLDRIDDAVGK
jgi:hypothetical protein